MGNTVSFGGKYLATYYLEKKRKVDGYTFEFDGLEALEKLLNAPDTDLTNEGESIGDIKLKLKADVCFGTFFSPEQRILNRCRD